MTNMTTNGMIVVLVLAFIILALALYALIAAMQRRQRKKKAEKLRRMKERALAWEAYENQLSFTRAVRDLDESTIRAFEAIIEELAQQMKQQEENRYADE